MAILRARKQGNVLGTSQGLYDLAAQSGLQSQADRVLREKGEQHKRIFSGGLVSDIFDALNALQYGVVGVLKGKGFAEGVRTRQSFSDKDALGDHGIPGMIAGIALDIAVDPLTYITPWTILKKTGALRKLKPAAKAAQATKAGQWFGRKFVYMFGADPVFRKTYERSIKNIAVGANNISDMTKGIANLAPETAKKLITKDETGRFMRVGLKQLQKVLSPKELESVSSLYKYLDDLGAQAVDLGLLKKATYEANVGEYIKNAYLEYEQRKGGAGLLGLAKKLGIKGIKARKTLTPEQMLKLGQIDNPAYLLFKSNIDLLKDVENANLFRQVASKFGSKTLKEGFKQLPDTKRLGDLAGKYIPENVFEYIQEIAKPMNYSVGKKLVAEFKFFKVIMNPATHGRNIISNQILNWWKIGMNPADPRVWGVNAEALGEIARKGGKWMDEARQVGYNLDTLTSNEITSLLGAPDAKSIVDKIGKYLPITPKVGLGKKMANLYQGEENFAKLAAFIFNRKYKKLGIEEAWKAAESATFNYAQVTPFIRTLRESLFGFPFVTFTYKATPLAVETALKAPRRMSAIGKIKNAIENQSDIHETEREKASAPSWIRDGFYIKLPIKDKHGRSAYFDLSYIIPFGDLVSGDFFERQVSRETGIEESVPSALLRKSPLFGFIKEISRNQDFYGDKIWKESDDSHKQLGDLMRHLTKTYLPPLVGEQVPGGHMAQGGRRIKGVRGVLTKEDKVKQQRTLMQEMLRNVGLKVQPIDVDIQETYMEWEKRKALENLLRESGALKEFRSLYTPK